jgi:hypothetical protein
VYGVFIFLRPAHLARAFRDAASDRRALGHHTVNFLHKRYPHVIAGFDASLLNA